MNVADLINKWKPIIDTGRHIFTWDGDGELAYLAELSSNAMNAVEHGVYMGRSSHVMLAANPHIHLWPCDPFTVAGTFETSKYFLSEFIKQHRCEIIQDGSIGASNMLQHMKGKLDFVFIDDGHAYEDVCLDIRCWYPLVKQGGIICGHDLDLNPDNEVARAVKHMLPEFYEPVPRIWAYTKP